LLLCVWVSTKDNEPAAAAKTEQGKTDFWQNPIRESFDKLCRQVSGFVWKVAVAEAVAVILNNTVARQPMNLTWFPFNAGNKTGNLYSA